ncbi:TPA: twin-arginine translocase TatA/TatE family subunit [Candidatus Galligastranaerophilus faecipullorum]|nr:twin-arginine translocase TatA/TatE family subunit [Candidatus Galligastranaerophilus faecipullorum]
MSLGVTEIILILVVILLLFGGKRIPEIARALGRASYEYKKAKNILKEEANGLKEAIENEAEKPEEYKPKDV